MNKTFKKEHIFVIQHKIGNKVVEEHVVCGVAKSVHDEKIYNDISFELCKSLIDMVFKDK